MATRCAECREWRVDEPEGPFGGRCVDWEVPLGACHCTGVRVSRNRVDTQQEKDVWARVLPPLQSSCTAMLGASSAVLLCSGRWGSPGTRGCAQAHRSCRPDVCSLPSRQTSHAARVARCAGASTTSAHTSTSGCQACRGDRTTHRLHSCCGAPPPQALLAVRRNRHGAQVPHVTVRRDVSYLLLRTQRMARVCVSSGPPSNSLPSIASYTCSPPLGVRGAPLPVVAVHVSSHVSCTVLWRSSKPLAGSSLAARARSARS